MAAVPGQSRVARFLFVVAALGAVALNAAHVFVGGPIFVGELFGSNALQPTAQWMGYFVWHIVTVLLSVIAAAFAYIALKYNTAVQHLKPLAYFATALLLGVAVLGVALGLASNGALSATPAPYAFGVLALLAVVGTVKMSA